MNSQPTPVKWHERIPPGFYIALIGVVVLGGIIGIVYLAADKRKTKAVAAVVASKDSVIHRKEDTLRLLKADTTTLRRNIDKLTGKLFEAVATLESERNAGHINEQVYQTNMREALAAADRAMDKKNALEKKAAADAASQRLNGQRLPTSVGDETTNGTVARLQAQIDVLSDSIPKLTAALGHKDAQIKTVTDQRDKAIREKEAAESDLERALNGADAVIAAGRKVAQDRRAAASKGPFRPIFNGNRIRDLGKVDSALATGQEQLRIKYRKK